MCYVIFECAIAYVLYKASKAFKENYFLSLPFQKEGSVKAQKASANHMSSSEQEL